MKVGVPKEVKNHEYRVAITPVGVHELVRHGHEVVRRDGRRSRLLRSPTRSTSPPARRSSTRADDVWGAADMVLKVKEPVAEEYHRLREGLTLFTYLHLAADKPLTEELMARKVTAHRLRDRAAALGRAAAALPDVRGRRAASRPRSAPTR